MADNQQDHNRDGRVTLDPRMLNMLAGVAPSTAGRMKETNKAPPQAKENPNEKTLLEWGPVSRPEVKKQIYVLAESYSFKSRLEGENEQNKLSSQFERLDQANVLKIATVILRLRPEFRAWLDYGFKPGLLYFSEFSLYVNMLCAWASSRNSEKYFDAHIRTILAKNEKRFNQTQQKRELANQVAAEQENKIKTLPGSSGSLNNQRQMMGQQQQQPPSKMLASRSFSGRPPARSMNSLPSISSSGNDGMKQEDRERGEQHYRTIHNDSSDSSDDEPQQGRGKNFLQEDGLYNDPETERKRNDLLGQVPLLRSRDLLKNGFIDSQTFYSKSRQGGQYPSSSSDDENEQEEEKEEGNEETSPNVVDRTTMRSRDLFQPIPSAEEINKMVKERISDAIDFENGDYGFVGATEQQDLALNTFAPRPIMLEKLKAVVSQRGGSNKGLLVKKYPQKNFRNFTPTILEPSSRRLCVFHSVADENAVQKFLQKQLPSTGGLHMLKPREHIEVPDSILEPLLIGLDGDAETGQHVAYNKNQEQMPQESEDDDQRQQEGGGKKNKQTGGFNPMSYVSTTTLAAAGAYLWYNRDSNLVRSVGERAGILERPMTARARDLQGVGSVVGDVLGQAANVTGSYFNNLFSSSPQQQQQQQQQQFSNRTEHPGYYGPQPSTSSQMPPQQQQQQSIPSYLNRVDQASNNIRLDTNRFGILGSMINGITAPGPYAAEAINAALLAGGFITAPIPAGTLYLLGPFIFKALGWGAGLGRDALSYVFPSLGRDAAQRDLMTPQNLGSMYNQLGMEGFYLPPDVSVKDALNHPNPVIRSAASMPNPLMELHQYLVHLSQGGEQNASLDRLVIMAMAKSPKFIKSLQKYKIPYNLQAYYWGMAQFARTQVTDSNGFGSPRHMSEGMPLPRRTPLQDAYKGIRAMHGNNDSQIKSMISNGQYPYSSLEPIMATDNTNSFSEQLKWFLQSDPVLNDKYSVEEWTGMFRDKNKTAWNADSKGSFVNVMNLLRTSDFFRISLNPTEREFLTELLQTHKGDRETMRLARSVGAAPERVFDVRERLLKIARPKNMPERYSLRNDSYYDYPLTSNRFVRAGWHVKKFGREVGKLGKYVYEGTKNTARGLKDLALGTPVTEENTEVPPFPSIVDENDDEEEIQGEENQTPQSFYTPPSSPPPAQTGGAGHGPDLEIDYGSSAVRFSKEHSIKSARALRHAYSVRKLPLRFWGGGKRERYNDLQLPTGRFNLSYVRDPDTSPHSNNMCFVNDTMYDDLYEPLTPDSIFVMDPWDMKGTATHLGLPNITNRTEKQYLKKGNFFTKEPRLQPVARDDDVKVGSNLSNSKPSAFMPSSSAGRGGEARKNNNNFPAKRLQPLQLPANQRDPFLAKHSTGRTEWDNQNKINDSQRKAKDNVEGAPSNIYLRQHNTRLNGNQSGLKLYVHSRHRASLRNGVKRVIYKNKLIFLDDRPDELLTIYALWTKEIQEGGGGTKVKSVPSVVLPIDWDKQKILNKQDYEISDSDEEDNERDLDLLKRYVYQDDKNVNKQSKRVVNGRTTKKVPMEFKKLFERHSLATRIRHPFYTLR